MHETMCIRIIQDKLVHFYVSFIVSKTFTQFVRFENNIVSLLVCLPNGGTNHGSMYRNLEIYITYSPFRQVFATSFYLDILLTFF